MFSTLVDCGDYHVVLNLSRLRHHRLQNGSSSYVLIEQEVRYK